MPHPHQITWDPASRFLFAPDLGEDRTYVYRLTSAGKFVAHDPAFVASPAGSGPRHIVFHPQGGYAYLLHEMGSLITVFAYESERGMLQPLQMLSTLPGDFAGSNTAAEVVVAPSGRFVYASNRGHDSLAILAVDQATGLLTPLDWVSTQGKIPRHFNLDPTGSFLYAENQDSGTVVTFRVDSITGRLTPTGHVVEAGSPACLVFGGA
jgi:6-phosphogluconolactonase (cycloisomerase 2 family)